MHIFPGAAASWDLGCDSGQILTQLKQFYQMVRRAGQLVDRLIGRARGQIQELIECNPLLETHWNYRQSMGRRGQRGGRRGYSPIARTTRSSRVGLSSRPCALGHRTSTGMVFATQFQLFSSSVGFGKYSSRNQLHDQGSRNL